MAIIITDLRTLIDEADSTTGWSGSVSPSLTTAAPAPIEATGSLGCVFSKISGYIFHTHGVTIDCSGVGKLVYGWVYNRGDPDTLANGGIGLVIGDGTDAVGYHLAGSDIKGFSHDSGGPYWQCLLLDTSRLPTYKTVWVGADSLVLTNIINFGYEVNNPVEKAVGGLSNWFFDAIRVGNDGLRITGGGVGTEGKFSEIAAEDASVANLKAFGIIRSLSSGIYGLQGPLTFGDISGTADVYFNDSNVVVAFEDRYISNDKYYLKIEGASGYTNSFILKNSTIKSAGPYVTIDFDNGNINTLTLDNVTFADLYNTVKFSNLADAVGHSVINCSFQTCGQIDPGDVLFQNNRISGYVGAEGGALLLDADGSANWSNLSFISPGTGHAIYITAPGTYTFSNFSYSGYATANGTTGNEVIYNNSNGAVTINVSGGDTPTVRNGSGATTTVSASYDFTITGLELNTEVTIVTAGTSTVLFNVENATTSDGNGKYQVTYTHSGGTVDVLIHHVDYKPDISNIYGLTLPNANSSTKVAMFADENYYNPA